jgi:glutamyl-Q tRNA(Asp) synthetase
MSSKAPPPQPPVTRFAPSPTGRLHLGHAFSAVQAHALARAAGGRFHLRIEDIDTGRCRPAFVDGILEDLEWLGLDWDGPVIRQSDRRPAHGQALEALRAQGLVYPCFCTRADIAAAASAPHGAPAAYPGTCRALDRAAAAARAARAPHALRLDVAAAVARTGPLTAREGDCTAPVDPRPGGDIVLARRDIGVGYLLASVVDDAAGGVTLVVRGRDLAEAVPVQRLLQALLGLAAPAWRHHRLLLAADGRRLAKRDRAETLQALRARGVDGRRLAERLRALPPEGPDLWLDPG